MLHFLSWQLEAIAEDEPFVCPITEELMDDPVIASDGYTYERAAIERVVTILGWCLYERVVATSSVNQLSNPA